MVTPPEYAVAAGVIPSFLGIYHQLRIHIEAPLGNYIVVVLALAAALVGWAVSLAVLFGIISPSRPPDRLVVVGLLAPGVLIFWRLGAVAWAARPWRELSRS